MNEFIEQFLLECRELIAQATDDLLALEENADDPERMDSAFRAFHTLKGAAGIVEFEAMVKTLHSAEDILSSLRTSKLSISSSVLNECVTCLDLTSRWLDSMQESGEVPLNAEADANDMIVRLADALETEKDPGSQTGKDWLDQIGSDAKLNFSTVRTAFLYVPAQETFFQGRDPIFALSLVPGLLSVHLRSAVPETLIEELNPFDCRLEVVALTTASANEVRSALSDPRDLVVVREYAKPIIQGTAEEMQSGATALLEAQVLLLKEASKGDGFIGRLTSAERTVSNVLRYMDRTAHADDIELAGAKSKSEGTADALILAIETALKRNRLIVEQRRVVEQRQVSGSVSVIATRALRVDLDRIDALTKLAGELIIVKNAIGHIGKNIQSGNDVGVVAADLKAQHVLLERLTGELQSAVLRVRVLPLRSVFRRFPRLVRETAASVGKTIRLVTEGDETEADATIVDSIFEPLLHILRNSVDHGIEKSDRRALAGKSPVGTITLRARRGADSVLIEVEDDGNGIDLERVKSVAVDKGVATPEALSAMTDEQVADLIFAAGFSTASSVTDLSGRGVGMDAVRTSVGQLGGSVTLTSRPGVGTTVRLIMPFSLMMTRVMTVEVAGQTFGLPLDTIVETAIIDRDRIKAIGMGRAFALRDRTIPLIDLGETLGIARVNQDVKHAKIVVTSALGQMGGIEVDALGERMDVMLKPMEGMLVGIRGIAGTTLLGNGRVLIVLDVQEMFN